MKKIRSLLIIIMLVVLIVIIQLRQSDSYTIRGIVTKLNKSKLMETIDFHNKERITFKPVNKISIDTSNNKNPIHGFGAALTESSAYLISNLNNPEQDQLLNDLFTEEGINTSMIRIPIGASDFALSSYTLEDTPENFTIENDLKYKIPIAKKINNIKPDVKFMASPWTAPSHMKSNLSLHGGSLNPHYVKDYANYLYNFIDSYEREGIPIYGLTVQNEPLHTTNSYPSMYMDETTQIDIINTLGKKLENNYQDVKIIAYDHNWDNIDYPSNIIKESEYASGAAFHCYAGNVDDIKNYLESVKNKNIWFTECSGGDWSDSFSNNIDWNLENVFYGMLNYKAKSVLLWNLALDDNNGPKNGGCSDCRGVITIHEDGTYTKNEEYYLIGHFSKYIKENSYIADLKNNSTQIDAVSFANEDSVTIVLYNRSFNEEPVTLFIDSYIKGIEVSLEANSLTTLNLIKK